MYNSYRTQRSTPKYQTLKKVHAIADLLAEKFHLTLNYRSNFWIDRYDDYGFYTCKIPLEGSAENLKAVREYLASIGHGNIRVKTGENHYKYGTRELVYRGDVRFVVPFID